MKQKQFEQHYESVWLDIENRLNDKKLANEDLPALYRRLCQHMALAKQRGYSPSLCDYLQKLASDCHQRLYGAVVERPFVLHHWLLYEMPRLVREEWRLFLFVNLSFWGVGLLVAALIWWNPDLIYSFTSAEELSKYKQMYKAGAIDVGRGESGDVMMFAHYIWNNVSIDFRTFAAGVFAGIPALLILAMNGLHLGVIGFYLSGDPLTSENFWSFVITHSSVEIMGMLLSGMAGMRLGLSLLSPGRLSRRHALYASARRMFPVLVGAALLTLMAAFIEGFWSASPDVSAQTKYIVGGLAWTSMIAFFLLAGRTRHT
jgi:uncharacterized membrane protein SpoIIM required for sporulation